MSSQTEQLADFDNLNEATTVTTHLGSLFLEQDLFLYLQKDLTPYPKDLSLSSLSELYICQTLKTISTCEWQNKPGQWTLL